MMNKIHQRSNVINKSRLVLLHAAIAMFLAGMISLPIVAFAKNSEPCAEAEQDVRILIPIEKCTKLPTDTHCYKYMSQQTNGTSWCVIGHLPSTDPTRVCATTCPSYPICVRTED